MSIARQLWIGIAGFGGTVLVILAQAAVVGSAPFA